MSSEHPLLKLLADPIPLFLIKKEKWTKEEILFWEPKKKKKNSKRKERTPLQFFSENSAGNLKYFIFHIKYFSYIGKVYNSWWIVLQLKYLTEGKGYLFSPPEI